MNKRFDSLLKHLVLRLFHGNDVVELVRPDVVDGDHVGVGPGGNVDVIVGQQAIARWRPHLRSKKRDLSA